MLPDLIKFPYEIMCSSIIALLRLFFIKFTVMSDSTSHNVSVIKYVFEDEGIKESARKSLPCNVDPMMLFQKKIKELCKDILTIFGKKKIKKRHFFCRHRVSFKVTYSKILKVVIELYKQRILC